MRNKIIAGLYALAALFTFGFAASENQKWREANCATIEQRLAGTACYGPPSGMVGIFASAFWPLYWSWKAQS